MESTVWTEFIEKLIQSFRAKLSEWKFQHHWTNSGLSGQFWGHFLIWSDFSSFFSSNLSKETWWIPNRKWCLNIPVDWSSFKTQTSLKITAWKSFNLKVSQFKGFSVSLSLRFRSNKAIEKFGFKHQDPFESSDKFAINKVWNLSN